MGQRHQPWMDGPGHECWEAPGERLSLRDGAWDHPFSGGTDEPASLPLADKSLRWSWGIKGEPLRSHGLPQWKEP